VAIKRDRATLRHLRTLFHDGTGRDLSDGQLLERFATDLGEPAERAFSALVERHGAMVLRVCRSVLIDTHDAQDAFQATFLVLVRKARGLWVRESLGPWLHQVAYRTALCARSRAARRRRHERNAAGRSEAAVVPNHEDWKSVLHEEIERLPVRFRAPLVVCDLGGQSQEQAARQLGLPIGTVKSRLSRGRDRLRDRLRQRGLAPDARLFPLALQPTGLDVLIPPALVESTTSLAVQFLTLRVFAPSSAGSLALEVVKVMGLARFWKVAAIGLVLGAGGTGVGVRLFAEKAGPIEGPGAVVAAQNAAVGGPGDAVGGQDMVVRPGKLAVIYNEAGVVQASASNDAYSDVEGQTTIISLVPEGTYVKKGQLVCELDSNALKDQLTANMIATRQAEGAHSNAKLEVELAKIALVEYREGIFKQEQASLQGEIEEWLQAQAKTQTRIARTKTAIERLNRAMIQPGAGSPADIAAEVELKDRLDDADDRLAQQSKALEFAQTKLMVLEKFTRELKGKQLESEIESKKANQLSKEAAVTLSRSKEDKIRRQIKNCTIQAPGDGMVVYAQDPTRPNTLTIEEGATVRERQKIFSIPNLSQPMSVVVKVPEGQIKELAPKLKASITVDAFFGETFTGRVTFVSPLPDAPTLFSPRGGKVFTTWVTLDKVFPGLRPGLTAQADIVVTALENALTVPTSAVVRYQGKDHVAVKLADAIEWREVTLGLSSGEAVEVKTGLKSGETVSLTPTSLMSDAEKREKFGVSTPKPGSRQ
jgi:HlyD family secretion protein